MEEKKSASIRVIENWDGDFISTNRIMRFEEMVKEDGEPWTPTYLTVMEDYHWGVQKVANLSPVFWI